MKMKSWPTLLLVLVLSGVIISLSVSATMPRGSDKSDIAQEELSPSAGTATVISVQWWKNGVNQGKIPFDSSGVGKIDVRAADIVIFKIKGTYKGSGTGYLLFYDLDDDYREAWVLKPGVITTKQVVRAYSFGADTYVRIEAHLPGSDYYGPGDCHRVDVNVI